MSNELIAGLVGAIIGGLITAFSSFFLSFYDKKSNLIMERAKAYKKLRSLWVAVWIDLEFRTTVEYSSARNEDRERYFQGIYKKFDQIVDVIDESIGLLSEEMTFLNQKLYSIASSVLKGMIENEPLIEFRNKVKKGMEYREKMMKLHSVECYLERAILNDGFLKFFQTVVFERRVKTWKKKNRTFFDELKKDIDKEFGSVELLNEEFTS